MDELGGYRELAPPARIIGDAVFIGMLFLTAFLERLQFQLRVTESSKWWASNGRDVVNAFALASMGLGLKVLGFTGPIAFLIASMMVLFLSVLQSSLGNRRLSTILSMAGALALGLPVILAPTMVHAFIRRTLELLFP
jgi:hypothetical protein